MGPFIAYSMHKKNLDVKMKVDYNISDLVAPVPSPDLVPSAHHPSSASSVVAPVLVVPVPAVAAVVLGHLMVAGGRVARGVAGVARVALLLLRVAAVAGGAHFVTVGHCLVYFFPSSFFVRETQVRARFFFFLDAWMDSLPSFLSHACADAERRRPLTQAVQSRREKCFFFLSLFLCIFSSTVDRESVRSCALSHRP